MNTLWFDIDSALDCFANHVASKIGAKLEECRIIRDVFGKLSIVATNDITPNDIIEIKSGIPSGLQIYLASPQFIILPTSSIAH